MKKWCILLLALTAALSGAQAQGGRGFLRQEWILEKGDSLAHILILPVPVFSRGVDLRRYQKLVRAVKRVYPVSKIARRKLAEMEERLGRTARSRRPTSGRSITKSRRSTPPFSNA